MDPSYAPHSSLFDYGNGYQSTQIGDFGTVRISKIHDGYADGTFVALMTKDDSSFSKLNITNGEFTNLKIVIK